MNALDTICVLSLTLMIRWNQDQVEFVLRSANLIDKIVPPRRKVVVLACQCRTLSVITFCYQIASL